MRVSVRKDVKAERKGFERWIVDFTGNDGKRKQNRFPTEAEALAEKAKIDADHIPYVAPNEAWTIAQAVADFIQTKKVFGRERATTDSYSYIARCYINKSIGHHKVTKFTTSMTMQYMRKLKEQGHSDHIVKRARTLLSMVMAHAQRNDLIKDNPIKAATFEPTDRDEERPAIPTMAEALALLNEAKRRDDYSDAMLGCMLFAGLRASEVRGLRVDDMELRGDSPCIKVRQRADAYNVIGRCKSKAGIRDIPIPAVLVQALREWKLKAPKNDKGLLFATRAGTPFLYSNLQLHWLDPLQIAAGVTDGVRIAKVQVKVKGRLVSREEEQPAPKFTFHSMRHFAISRFIEAEATIREVMTWAGHANVAITLNTYSHIIDGGRNRAPMLAKLQEGFA